MATVATPPSFAAMAAKETKKAPLRVVQVEGHVLLKIAKHCREQATSTTVVTGQLLGLDVGQTLQVTDCFPFPGNAGEEEGEPASASGDGESYQLEMMRCLRETNADNNMVGWYQSAVSGSYQVVEIVETFANYSDNLDRCVCLVHDAAASAAGQAGLKAVRLADAFLAAYREGKLTVEAVRASGISWRDAFVEIPISVRNSALSVALAASLDAPLALGAADLDRLDLGVADALGRDLDLLSDCLDDVVAEQGKLGAHAAAARRTAAAAAQFRLHRRQENATRRAAGEEPLPEEPPEGQFKPPPEPSQLESFLVENQASSYATHLDAAACLAIEKLMLVEGLQRAHRA